jgi:hypothetical protein
MARPGGWARTAIGTFQRNRLLWAVVRTPNHGLGRARPSYTAWMARPDAVDPGFHGARTQWIRGFMTLQLARAHGYRFVRV